MESRPDSGQTISRRDLLKRASFVLGAMAVPMLASCGTPPSQQTTSAPTAAAPKAAAPAPAPAAPPAAPAAAPAASPAAAQPAQQAPGKPGGAVNLKFLSWYWAEKGRNDAWRAVVEKFHASQNDIRIEEVGFPFSEYFQRVTTQLAGGRLDADVLLFTDELFVRLAKGNFLEPVDEAATMAGIKDKLDKPTHDFVSANGKLYALLALNLSYALIHNRELLEKAGIAKPPNTMDEVFEISKQLTKRPDQFGYAGRNTMQEQNGFFQDISHWVLGHGGQYIKAKKPTVAEAPVINAVKAYKRLYDESMPQGSDASTYRRLMWEGKVLQYIDNSGNILILKAGNEEIYPKLNSAPPPWENRRGISITNYLGVYNGSPNKQAAMTWLGFLYRPENLGPLLQSTLETYSPFSGALSDEYLKTLHWVGGFQQSKGTPLPMMVEGLEANMAEVRQIFLSKVSEVLTTGKSAEDAMAEAQKSLEELAGRV
jgi:multiple sugar transport system substrate-binding protein